MEIKVDDLSGAKTQGLIQLHLQGMFENTPAESVHALNLDGLRKPEITFWSAWEGDELLGCGALKELDETHGEIKSMRTVAAHLRKGVSRSILEHIIGVAQSRGYKRLSLETGATEDFLPARRLYEAAGFEYCEPFADYVLDPYSAYMTKAL